MYNHYRDSADKVIWRCVYYTNGKRNGRCYTSSKSKNGNIIMEFEQKHAPEPEKIEAAKIRAKIRAKAKSSKESTGNIVATAVNNASTSCAGVLGNRNNLNRLVSRIRTVNKVLPDNPTTINNFVIPDEYRKTWNGKEFMICSSNELNDNLNGRYVIFTTKQNLNYLGASDTWYCDGTFYIVPTIFHQLYSIHGIINGEIVPLVFVLLTGKSKKLYRAMLRQLKLIEPRLKPKFKISDFEQAFIRAAEKVFNGVEMCGCYFHFGQSIWRKIQGCGLQAKYAKDGDYAQQLKMLYALAFVPVDDVPAAYDTLIKTPFYIEHADELKELLDYFEATWVGGLNRRGRTGSTFNIKLWNQYLSALKGDHRTNNAVEGWHCGLRNRTQAAHLNVWKFIDLLRDEQALIDLRLEQLIRGDTSKKSKANYIRNNRRIINVVKKYHDIPIEEYLRGISHSIKF